ncbi:Histidine kinase-, DNA gyrase B-, and HSP90-like ATPase [Ruminococcaceae bacterium FB2012]|nr:Histidine kinase-, DNA gyrase B-, and HSP90-like ATPase [Ruminococcaceae bacterium FB2012]
MNITDAVKAVYSCSKEKAVLYDEKFRFIWRNTDDIIPPVFDELIFDGSEPRRLPIEQETVCRLGESAAVRITPLCEEGKLCAYLLVLYDIEDVQRIFAHSAKQKEQEVLMGNVRNGLAGLSITADKLRSNPLYYAPDAAKEIRAALLNTLSATTNQSIVNRIWSGKVKLTSVDVSAELAHSAEETARLMNSEFCELTADIARGVYVKAAWNLLESAVLNLIVNAYMYCNAVKKQIALTLRRVDNDAVITVSDNGTGADIARIEKLSHYRTREIEYKQRECLGLALARSAAELFGGSLKLEPSPTGGLAASIVLPCRDSNDFILHSSQKTLRFFPLDYQMCILSKGGINDNDKETN